MADFFPNVAYKEGKNKPGNYPDEGIAALGAAYDVVSKVNPGLSKLSKEMIVSNVLRENRPNDLGMDAYRFDKKSKYDRSLIDNLAKSYKAAGLEDPEYEPLQETDKSGKPTGRTLYTNKDWKSDMLTKNTSHKDDTNFDSKFRASIQALNLLARFSDQHGPEMAFERWNGKGSGKGYSAHGHSEAVYSQLDALKANPKHLRNIMNLMDSGAKDPEAWRLRKQMTEPKGFKPAPVAADSFSPFAMLQNLFAGFDL